MGASRSFLRLLGAIFLASGLVAPVAAWSKAEFKSDLIQLRAVSGVPFRVNLKQLLKSSDPNIAWSYERSKPGWVQMTVDALTGMPLTSDEGVTRFRIFARDAQSSPVTILELRVAAPSDNQFFDLGSAEEGAYFLCDLNQLVPQLPGRPTFSTSDAPGWLTVGSDGWASGVPVANNVGTFTFGLAFSSGEHSSAMSIIGAVRKHVLYPQWVGNPLVGNDARVNLPYAIDISGAVRPGVAPALSFVLVAGPAWLNISESGVLRGIPGAADAGATSVTVKVRATIDAETYEEDCVIQFTVW